ncbi:hypothetical protein TH63_02735 [Rufibacter radiotolerans]|uniref:N-acetyltransferase domain-containing protein n=1 Tax=Rufibacter radiotolerans TaxID=1379910 RepID=A0A0H4VGQ2_9BACT|nr:UDP-2,4-diacetamido-2,4,6-trideoxy-beta-L-altropyranose hydrolase [Rufibacter radiotolerans]AKQ44785.1 hypothetical protein TH63_02735 [Rufibacter radiotolerans]
MITKKKIFFRADGSSDIGLGHLVRSSALADMLKEKFDCVLATRCEIYTVIETLKSSFSEIISLPEQEYSLEAKLMADMIPSQSLIVLDGYNFDSTYQELLVNNGFDLFSIDDIHAFQFHSKVIINHAGGIDPLDYRALPTTQFFLGPRYSLLREPFLKAAKQRRNSITNKNCFVCFGGADPDNKTLEILKNKNIRESAYFDNFHVVVGGAFKHKEALESYIQNQDITLYYALTSEEMVSLMQHCSYAICSPSSIVYEYMSVGGIVFLEQIADNQSDIIKFFLTEEMAFRINDLESLSTEKIENAFKKQSYYFDGSSDDRLRSVFQQYYDSKKLSIRRVNKNDLDICFSWANDVEVRGQSYNQSAIDLQSHIIWFNKKLNDLDVFFYILEKDEKPVAQIRFQKTNKKAVLSFLADKSIRHKGLGSSILSKGINAFLQEVKAPIEIVGFVKKSNVASQRSFEKLSFVKEESGEYAESYKYSLHCSN